MTPAERAQASRELINDLSARLKESTAFSAAAASQQLGEVTPNGPLPFIHNDRYYTFKGEFAEGFRRMKLVQFGPPRGDTHEWRDTLEVRTFATVESDDGYVHFDRMYPREVGTTPRDNSPEAVREARKLISQL